LFIVASNRAGFEALDSAISVDFRLENSFGMERARVCRLVFGYPSLVVAQCFEF
jgi:hypothetical protein